MTSVTSKTTTPPAAWRGFVGAVLGAAGTAALAQEAPAPSGPLASQPSPYYIGAAQTLTHDSNVFRVPSGPSDNYSSTSLFGGIDQRLSRQRVFGVGSVSANRYQNETQLDNTSYSLATGLDWETIASLSGNVRAATSRSLSSPVARATTPTEQRNIARSNRVDGLARWGGDGLLSLEATAGYASIDYSAPQYVASESTLNTASVGAFYRPGAALRVGLVARADRVRTPQALFDPATNSYSGNTVRSRNIDLRADYVVSDLISANGRLSYTRQTNASDLDSADFSGLTGSLGLRWQPTGRITSNLYVAREAGFNSSAFNAVGGSAVTTLAPPVAPGTTPATPPPAAAAPVITPVSAPVAGLYQNNQVTDSIGIGANYAVTGKIGAHAGARYARARLISIVRSTTAPVTTDRLRTAYLGASYAIARNWGLGCNFAHALRDVSGVVDYSYSANSVGCSAQYTWR